MSAENRTTCADGGERTRKLRIRMRDGHIPRWILTLWLLAVLAHLTGCPRVEAPPPPPAPAPAPPPPPPPPPNVLRFPWPPPPASAEAAIPRNWISTSEPTRLAQVAETLERALRAARYPKWAYAYVPNGFALVTQMERIKRDGTASLEPARWSTDLPAVTELSPFEFIKALAIAPAGYYRVIVFIVSDQPWSRDGERPSGSEAQRWLAQGMTKLPASMGQIAYTTDFTTTALVYEFKKKTAGADATLVQQSEARAEDHLKKAGIYDPLSGWR